MRYLLLTILGSGMLWGCHTQPVSPLTPALVSTLKNIDLSQSPSMLEQHRVGMFSVGSWVNQKPGQLFQRVKPQHPQAAVVYLYRPDSRWNRQEVVAPNFFLNGERIPSLISNHYYWLELAEGHYRLTISRPLGVIHFQKPVVADFKVSAGQQYFLKYEEEKFRGSPDHNLGLLRAGPLMQMPVKQGLREIRTTQLKSPGLNFAAFTDAQGKLTEPKRKIVKQNYEEGEELALKKRFKLWNPLTW